MPNNPRQMIAEILSSREDKPETEPEIQTTLGDGSTQNDQGDPEESREAKPDEADPKPVDDTNDGDEEFVEYITDLAPHLELEPEQLYGLKMKLSDGEDPMTLGEVKDAIQEARRQKGEFTEAQSRVSELEQALQQMQAAPQQPAQQQPDIASLDEQGQAAWREMVESQIDHERINWDELEKVDPGRAALEKQKILQRHSTAKKTVQEAQARMEQLRQQQFQQYKQQQDAELLKRIPEWGTDREAALSEVKNILEWAHGTYGINDQEMAGVIDWRQRDMMRKACLYDKLQQQRQEIERGAPKQIKGGIRLRKSDVQQRKVGELVKKARGGARSDKIAAGRAVLDQAFAKR